MRGTMQTFRSAYGRKGCRVSLRCPTRAIRRHLANTHVATEPRAVVAEIDAEIRRQQERGAVWTAQDIRDAERFAVWQHAENLAEYRAVMGGSV